MIAVSACLLGCNCRYDGRSRKNSALVRQLKSENILPICPEQLGGLPSPRDPCRLVDGNGFDVLDGRAKVISVNGVDHTRAFVGGAYCAWRQMVQHRIRRCFLKENSPS